MRRLRSIAFAALAATCATVIVLPGHAQTRQVYPIKPVRLVVAFSAGGTPDTLARLLSPKMSESWRQPIVIENRPGAGGTIAAGIVAKAAPDGYTLLMTSPAFPIAAALHANLPYDTLKDFAGITNIGFSTTVMVAAPALGIKSVKEIARILELPDVKERLQAVAFHIAPSTPEETDRMLRADVETFTKVVREAGLRTK